MIQITIDDKKYEIEPGFTIIQACEILGIEIPRFCYHERLAIAGNCRMCLVEVEKVPKPVASCAMPIVDGMIIKTLTPMVKKAREGVMELLLINHPLDCPICDQGGECDLQDQAYKYGRPTSRYGDFKRAVPDKYMGPLVKTHMTRCIHCTRCIRFATEVAGIEEIGAIGRGENMEITTYLEKSLQSELSANIIDLCPVGALTSKPYAYKARNWELVKTESIDILDAVCSNIRIDARGLEVMRILPKINEDVNEEWISDKARFFYDGLKNQRLTVPMIREEGLLKEVEMEIAISKAAEMLKNTDPSKIAFITGSLVEVESLFMLRKIADLLKIKNLTTDQGHLYFNTSSRGNYLFNTGIKNIENADLCLLIGANPRVNAPVLNTRIRKAYTNGLKIARIGEAYDLTYKVQELGESPDILSDILEGRHAFAELIKSAKNPMIIIGDEAMIRSDAEAIYGEALKIAFKYNMIREDFNGFNILHNSASQVGALDLGFCSDLNKIQDLVKEGKIQLLFLLGADNNIDIQKIKNCSIIYQGHHGDISANVADVILPGAAFTEKEGIFLNLEGRVQKIRRAVAPPVKALEDFIILGKIAQDLGLELEVENSSELRRKIGYKLPHMVNYDHITKSVVLDFTTDKEIRKEGIKKINKNFYMTDSITRSSKIMAECSRQKMIKKDA